MEAADAAAAAAWYMPVSRVVVWCATCGIDVRYTPTARSRTHLAEKTKRRCRAVPRSMAAVLCGRDPDTSQLQAISPCNTVVWRHIRGGDNFTYRIYIYIYIYICIGAYREREREREREGRRDCVMSTAAYWWLELFGARIQRMHSERCLLAPDTTSVIGIRKIISNRIIIFMRSTGAPPVGFNSTRIGRNLPGLVSTFVYLKSMTRNRRCQYRRTSVISTSVIWKLNS